MPQKKLMPKFIEAAIDGFLYRKQQLINELDAQIAELRAMLPGADTQPATAPEAPPPKRKKFSAAARRKMALAQKARWAKIRGESEPSPAVTPEPAKPKRKLSAAGRRAISEATKKRWALKRAAEAAQAKKSAPAKKKAPRARAAKRAPVKRAAKTAPAPAPTTQAAG